MTLKNLMEEKQLNFNRPLLSVRRGSSTAAPPEVNSRRKTDNTSRTLPPLPYYKSDIKSGPIRNPGVVPFQWEKTPGKPKDQNKGQRRTPEQPPLAPRLPPGRVVNQKQTPTNNKVLNDSPGSSSKSHSENINIPSFLETSTDKAASELEGSEKELEGEGVSSSDDENVTYEDARDTLSRTESFFYNCSVSGVSGLDGPNMGTFTDPQARDFMMGRFLPAAKAVATETPQFASRKHPVAKEKPKPVEKAIKWKKRAPQFYDLSNTLPQDVHGLGEREKEEDDEVDEYDGPEVMSAKLCGLLPRFCLLNPIPGMRDHAQVFSPVRSVRTRPAYAGVYNKREKDGTDTHRAELRRTTCQKCSSSEPSLNGHLGDDGVPPCRNRSAQTFLGKERDNLCLPEEPRDLRTDRLDPHKKGSTKFKQLLADRNAEETTCLVNPVMERTLYIDSEQRVEPWDSNSSSSESRGRNPSVDYSLQDIKSLCGAEEKAVSPPKKSSDTADSSVLSLSEDSSQGIRESPAKHSKNDLVGLMVDFQPPPELDSKESTMKSGPTLALGPLLPKTPSESWLSRTLPSMTSKNPSSKSYMGSPAFRQSPVDPKRERMLRSLNGQHLFLRPPGELAPILEN